MDKSKQTALDSADSVGFLVDRCLEDNDIIGSGFLVDQGKLVTLGTFVLPFGVSLEGLKVVFPRLRREYGVASAFFHPQFNRRFTRMTVERTMVKAPDLTLRKNNCVVLELTEQLDPITPDIITKINDTYSANRNSWDKGLSGSLDEIDLSLVIQTISNAKKSGQLVVSDQRNRPIAKVFFNDGKVFHAQFRHLAKEKAFNQLIAAKVSGFFEFRPSKEVDLSIISPIAKPTDMLLLEAYRRLDELNQLQMTVGGPGAFMARAKAYLDTNFLSPELRERAEHIWRLLDGLTPNGRLWELIALDEYDVYQVLVSLFQTDQLKPVAVDGTLFPAKVESLISLKPTLRPVPFAEGPKVADHEIIMCIGINPTSSFVTPREGTILGTAIDTDREHLSHTAAVLFENIGSPIFQDGKVVGMHCGVLPPFKNSENSIGFMQQMLSSNSLMRCLAECQQVGRTQPFMRVPNQNVATPNDPAGVHDQEGQSVVSLLGTSGSSVAAASRIENQSISGQHRSGRNLRAGIAKPACPNCGATRFNPPERCSRCGFDPTRAAKLSISALKRYAAISLTAVIVGLIASGFFWLNLPQPLMAKPDLVIVPSKPWLRVSIQQANVATGEWTPQLDGKLFHKKDLICFHVSVFKDSYVYLLDRGSQGNKTDLIYPNYLQREVLKKRNTSFTCPEVAMQKIAEQEIGPTTHHVTAVLTAPHFEGPPGLESVLVIASAKPLELGNQPRELQKLFDRASNFVLASDSNCGAEISKEQLFGPSEGTDSSNSAAVDEPIYLTSFVARHD
jgi:hypothetical protein